MDFFPNVFKMATWFYLFCRPAGISQPVSKEQHKAQNDDVTQWKGRIKWSDTAGGPKGIVKGQQVEI